MWSVFSKILKILFIGVDQNIEVPELCQLLIGKWAEILARIFSIVVLIGADIVYWILMSNFLYYSVYLIHGKFSVNIWIQFHWFILNVSDVIYNIDQTELLPDSIICNMEMSTLNQTHLLQSTVETILNVSSFEQFWDLYSTVPVILGVIMFPLLNFKSPTFFTKFNSFGKCWST